MLALLVWGLNPGIDFTNGATIGLRFANSSPALTSSITNAFHGARAKDLQVLSSTDLSGSTPADQYVYIRFSRPIGTNFSKSVLQLLEDPKTKLPAVQTNSVHTTFVVNCPSSAKTKICPDGDKTSFGLMVVPFAAKVKTEAIQAALAKLPQTDAPPAVESTNTSATPTAAATGTATTTASATPTAPATASGATGTPAATTFPVSVEDIQLGANSNTYTVETQTFLSGPQSRQYRVRAPAAIRLRLYSVQRPGGTGHRVGNDGQRRRRRRVRRARHPASTSPSPSAKWAASDVRSRFGASAIIALLHDALVVLGFWAIFGHFFGFKVDSLFLTAILTVIGFSVHDTIVVFDRIRENLSRRTVETFETIVNASLVQTMSRSLNTSLTVLFTLAALTLFGGESIREFTLALLIGIASGTYSSIFNASMMLVVWETGEWRGWWPFRYFIKPRTEPTASQRRLVGAGAR